MDLSFRFPAFLKSLPPAAAIALFAASPVATASGSLSEISSIIDQFQTDHQVPGMLVGIWKGDTEVALFEKGFADLGLNSGTPDAMTRDHSMRIASLTKTFTVTRVLQLLEEHQVSLDTPVSSILPSSVVGLPNATIRQLAAMNSGIFNYTESPEFISVYVQDFAREWAPQELVDYAKDQPSTGSGFYYSNTNTVLLGMVIEALSGKSIAQEINTMVASAGLLNTYYPVTIDMPNPYAKGYANLFGDGLEDRTAVSPTSAAGSGAMISTLDDLAAWAKFIATGTLLSEEMQEERLKFNSTDGNGDYYDTYGLGIATINDWIGHTGAFIGYEHLMLYDPATDQTIVIMSNLSGSGGHLPSELFLQLQPHLVPEPSSCALLVGSVGALYLLRRRRNS